MKFPEPLIPARLIRRYKRFLADVELAGGQVATAHCPNTGAMLGCDRPGSRIWLSRSANPRRKYSLTWELVEGRAGVLVGIHSARANALTAEALGEGAPAGLDGLRLVRREYRPEGLRSRFDLLAVDAAGGAVLIEVKSVTAAEDAVAFFPDAVSARATRHVEELAGLARRGKRVMLVFCVQRGDVDRVRPAAEIDPAYARALDGALAAGLETVALGCAVTPEGIGIDRGLEFAPAVV